MAKTETIYDEVCGWPYHTPYGMVKVAKPKKPRKPRVRAMKVKMPKKPKEKRVRKPRTPRPIPLDYFVKRPPINMDEFVSCAMRECEP